MTAVRRPVVAIQGELGSFSEDAVTRYWSGRAGILPQLDCWRVARAVRDGRATHGMLAIENLIAGPVAESHDALAATTEVAVIGEIVVPIRLCLLAPPGAALDTVRQVFSHRMALRQCTRFLQRHAHVVAREAYDTAGAARDVAARGNVCEAAVASRTCAARYGLQVLAEDIEDRHDNATRFWVVARRDAVAVGHAL
jgi:prephenate dehydratase